MVEDNFPTPSNTYNLEFFFTTKVYLKHLSIFHLGVLYTMQLERAKASGINPAHFLYLNSYFNFDELASNRIYN